MQSLLLTTKLPDTWSALQEGRIDVRRMRALVDLRSTAGPKIAAGIERRVLPGAENLTAPSCVSGCAGPWPRLDAVTTASTPPDRLRC